MAYMNQERKAKLAANLKKVIPAGWKYTLSVRHHMSLVLTIQSAPVDLPAEYQRVHNKHYGHEPRNLLDTPPESFDVNTYWLDHQFDESLELFQAIKTAMNDGNHDNSDPMTDYFDVGWYIDIKIGRWDKPFVFLAPVKEAALTRAETQLGICCVIDVTGCTRLKTS